MPSVTYRRLAICWLYWVVAYAAAAGTLAGVGKLGEWYRSVRHDELSLILLQLATLLVLAVVQQLMLHRAGLNSGWWVLACVVGCCAGVVTGGLVYSVVEVLSTPPANEVWSFLGFGAALGASQAICLSRSRREYLTWVAWSSLGATVALVVVGGYLRSWARRHDVEAATVLGGIYGGLTGIALVRLVHFRGSSLTAPSAPAATPAKT